MGLTDDFPVAAANALSEGLPPTKNESIFSVGLPLAPPIFPMPKDARFPSAAIPVVGCLRCDWKRKGLCPFGLRDGESHAQGICLDRKGFVFAHYRGGKPRPRASAVLADYQQALAHQRLLSDEDSLVVVEDRLKRLSLRNDVDDSVKKSALGDYLMARSHWFELYKEVMKVEMRDLDRHHVKKSEVLIERKPSPSDVAKLLKSVQSTVIEPEQIEDKDGDDEDE